MIPSFNIETVEHKMLNYVIQSQQAQLPDRVCRRSSATVININVTELGKQAVKEHKDIHKLVASKMFDVPYDEVTDEQRCIAKTADFKFMYKAGLII